VAHNHNPPPHFPGDRLMRLGFFLFRHGEGIEGHQIIGLDSRLNVSLADNNLKICPVIRIANPSYKHQVPSLVRAVPRVRGDERPKGLYIPERC
jgi:hypothetical protein